MFDEEPRLKKHVPIVYNDTPYGNEEIQDIFGRRTQMQEPVAHTRIFSV